MGKWFKELWICIRPAIDGIAIFWRRLMRAVHWSAPGTR